jgi:3-oxoacyl-[acyl-carrier-protein] synthase II
MEKKRVVITGMGTLNPLGHTVEDSWEKAKNGISGIDRISHFDPKDYAAQIAGEVRGFDFAEHYSEGFRKQAKRLDEFTHFAMAASRQAVDQSGIDIAANPWDVGVVIGSGIGGLPSQQSNAISLGNRGPRGVGPMYIPATIGNIASGVVSMELGAQGPNMATQTACATANHAFAVGYMMIQMGYCSTVVAGGAEDSVVEIAVAGFSRMQALSTKYNDTPTKASRPYDKGRDGFVMGEGAGILVLEEYEHAKARGANILAELAAVGMSGDAHDLVVPHPEGVGALYSMEMAVKYAGINPEDIDYINTHGTSTPLGDIAESKAVYRLLKGNEDRVHVGSTKSMHGHLLGATAALEAILTIKAMNEGVVPPNINIEEFDDGVALKPETINTEAIEKDITVAMSNSFGFGGHNSTIILKKI